MMRVDWARAVEQFSTGLFPMHLTYTTCGPVWARRIDVTLRAINIRTGIPTIVGQLHEMPPDELPDHQCVAEYLFNLGVQLVGHELREQIRYRGEHVLDPHRGE